MRRLTVWIVLALVVAMVSVGSVPANVLAVEYGGVGGKPAHPQADNPRTQSIFVYTLKPESQKTDGVKVFNSTPDTRTITLAAVDSVLTSDGAFSCAQAVEPRLDVGSWITLKQTTVTLKPNSSQIIPFTVKVSKTAGAGEHDGCITLQDSSNKTANKQSGVILSFRSAIRVAITVPGKLVKNLRIENVSVTQNTTGNYIVTPLVYNGGNVSLDTQIRSSLNSLLGQKVRGNAQTYPVLPHSRTSWNFEFKRPFWGGWYHAAVSVTFSNDPKASLGQKSGGETTITAKSAAFFATPAPLAGAIEIVALLIIAGVVLRLFQRGRHTKHVKQHWQLYSVASGETLQTIAKARKTSWKKLAAANRLKPPYHLEPGHKLKVPPKPED